MSCESFDFGRCDDCWLATGIATDLGAAFQEVYARGQEKRPGAQYQLGYLDVVGAKLFNVVESCPRQELPEGEAARQKYGLPPEHCYSQPDLGEYEKPVAELAQAAMIRAVGRS